MKNLLKTIVALSVTILIGSAFISANAPEESMLTDGQDKNQIEIAGDVKEIIENKCMGCHNPEARNEKARKKLQWVNVPKMNKEEQEHLVDELFEVLEDGKMPPKRAVERRPQMKLTDEETKILLAWAEKEEKRLKGK